MSLILELPQQQSQKYEFVYMYLYSSAYSATPAKTKKVTSLSNQKKVYLDFKLIVQYLFVTFSICGAVQQSPITV